MQTAAAIKSFNATAVRLEIEGKTMQRATLENNKKYVCIYICKSDQLNENAKMLATKLHQLQLIKLNSWRRGSRGLETEAVAVPETRALPSAHSARRKQ